MRVKLAGQFCVAINSMRFPSIEFVARIKFYDSCSHHSTRYRQDRIAMAPPVSTEVFISQRSAIGLTSAVGQDPSKIDASFVDVLEHHPISPLNVMVVELVSTELMALS